MIIRTVKRANLIHHGKQTFNKKTFFYGKADVSILKTEKEQGHIHQLADSEETFLGSIPVQSPKELKKPSYHHFPDQTPKAYKVLNEEISDYMEGRTGQWNSSCSFLLVWEEWLESPFDVTPSKAEPFKKFKDRVQSIVEEIRETDDDELR